MKNTRYILPLLLLAACSRQPETQQAAAEKAPAESTVTFTEVQWKNAGIATGQVEKRSLTSVLKVNGTVDVPPQNLVSVSFPLGGYLASTDLLPGMKIKKGQVIAVMEDQSYVQLQQDYLVAASQLELLRKEAERQRTLNVTKSSSDKVFEQSQADYYAQQVNVRALKEKLLLIGIRPENLNENRISRSVPVLSPIDGYVSQVLVNVGKYVEPADVMFELVNPSDLHLALTVFEKDLPFIQPGQKVIAATTANPDIRFEAEVILVGRNVTEHSATTVHCHFRNKDEGLFPGMSVTAGIGITKADAPAVPQDGLVRWKENEYVFVSSGEKQFRMVRVQTGIVHEGWVEITGSDEPLEGKTIISRNAWSALMMLENKAE